MTIIHIPKAFVHPMPDPRDPDVTVHSLADGDVCIGCGCPTRYHRSLSGVWVGCRGALKAHQPPKNPERWNDPYPAVTCEARAALILDCGPAMEIFLARFTHDEVLTMAHTIATRVIAAYKREVAK
jgi:hypothetical protein